MKRDGQKEMAKTIEHKKPLLMMERYKKNVIAI